MIHNITSKKLKIYKLPKQNKKRNKPLKQNITLNISDEDENEVLT